MFLQLFTVYAQPIESLKGHACVVDGVPTLQCFEVVFRNILFMASSLVVLILFIMIVRGALMYLTSGGNPEKVDKAQGTIKWAVIGVALFMVSYLVIKIIQTLFLKDDADLLKFKLPEIENSVPSSGSGSGSGSSPADAPINIQ